MLGVALDGLVDIRGLDLHSNVAQFPLSQQERHVCSDVKAANLKVAMEYGCQGLKSPIRVYPFCHVQKQSDSHDLSVWFRLTLYLGCKRLITPV